MARGLNFSNTYGDRLLGPGLGNCTGNGPTDIPLTQFILNEFNIPSIGQIAGSTLPEYDIKSQDALQVFRLSLLASSNGSLFKEVYLNGEGAAFTVTVGETLAIKGNNAILLHTQNINTDQEVVNHVVAHSKAPLPERRYGGTVDLMGNGTSKQFQFNCPITYNPKNDTLAKEAWVEFPRSEQSEETKELLKAAVDRENWENLLGYRAQFADIDIWSTISPSPTSASAEGLPVASSIDIPVQLDNTPDSGGVTDISGVSMASAPVLDIKLGSELSNTASDFGIDLENDSLSFFDPDAWYVLLSPECGMNSLGRGTNWFLLPTNDPTKAIVSIRDSSAEGVANSALNGAVYGPAGLRSTRVYRSSNTFVASFEDVMAENAAQGQPLLGSNVGVAKADPAHGSLKAGMGGNLGLEIWAMSLTYTKQRASIQVRSQNNDAMAQANKVQAEGVQYSAVIVQETPAGAGLAPEGGPVFPVPPNNDETATYCPETILDTLEGSVMEVSVPWLDATGAQEFASNLYNLILTESPIATTFTYTSGWYNAFPGMVAEDGGIIHSVEFSYADQSSQTVTITTGPKFYQPGGAGSDSRYIKRSETLSKPGVVIGGDNESGTFSVQVDGLGIYEAINGQIDTVFPGDRVDIKIMNYPVER